MFCTFKRLIFLNDNLNSIYDLNIIRSNGTQESLAKYKGFVMVFVNVASKCGLTNRVMVILNKLLENYYEKGLRIMLFPSNDYRQNSDGSNGYNKKLESLFPNGHKFELMRETKIFSNEKSDPNSQLYSFLQKNAGRVKWNYQLFVVAKNGKKIWNISPLKQFFEKIFSFLNPKSTIEATIEEAINE